MRASPAFPFALAMRGVVRAREIALGMSLLCALATGANAAPAIDVRQSVTAPSHAIVAPAKNRMDAKTRRAILDCTFEVLTGLRDRAPDAPDVRVAGTAFCFSERELASAAHVFDPVLGGRFEVPVVRDRRGRTYPIEQVTRYSSRDDFVTFTVAGLEALPAPPHSTYDESNRTLHLAWRRSDGDIAFATTGYRGRTSVDTFGRDGWIEFGPAPGHGASGAALFDANGQVVGLINSRSSEAADAHAFAVPIAVIEGASTQWADITVRDPMRRLGMPSERNLPLVGGIPLPAGYEKFERHLVDVRRTYFAHTLPYSLSLEGEGAPMSDEARAGLCIALGPEYCSDSGTATARLIRAARPAQGCDVAWQGVDAALVRCIADERVDRASFSTSAQDLPDRIRLGRQSTPAPPAPCRSDDPLEPAVAAEPFVDATGATWQVQASPVRGCDWVVVSLSRSLRDGSLTLVRGAPSAYADVAAMQLKALASIRFGGNRLAPQEAVLAEAERASAEHSR